VRAQHLEDKNQELKNYAANIKTKELEVKDLVSLHGLMQVANIVECRQVEGFSRLLVA